MTEAYVRLLCPECKKDWEDSPGELPESNRTFHCPSCHASRPMAEFTRTEHDLKTLKQLS